MPISGVLLIDASGLSRQTLRGDLLQLLPDFVTCPQELIRFLGGHVSVSREIRLR